ncbi:MAG TPA: hypothetical protein DCG53_07510 [Syntrophus sp. (in: bacteria)]|nr:hypothetical protein [Syntrophus sp. (in: bacteria)]
MKKFKAFVAHSFNKRDEDVVRIFLKYFDSLKETAGLIWEHAEKPEARAISEKVKEKMKGKNLFIGIFTAKDYRIDRDKLNSIFIYRYGEKEFFSEGSSDWIIQESGYALANDMKLLFLIENGVDVNAALQGDLEHVNFSRENPSACFNDINEMLGSIIIESRDTTSTPTSASPPEINKDNIDNEQSRDEIPQDEILSPTRKFINEYGTLWDLVCDKKDIIEAEKKLTELILEFKDSDKYSPSFWKGSFCKFKMEAGFSEALNELELLCNEDPNDIIPLKILANSYNIYGQYLKAADLFVIISKKVSIIKDRVDFVGKAADCYASDNHFNKAYNILLAEFKNNDLDSSILHILYKKLAEIAKMQNNINLFTAFAEKALEIFPTDYSLRFSLAFSYEEVGNTARSLAHYQFLCEHNPDGSNFNNIGVAYSKLDIKGKAIESFKKAANEYDESLSMANIALSYINQGFLNEAQDILSVARTKSNVHKNVDSATARINDVKEEEEEALKKALKKVDPEQKFLIKFAEAYALPSEVDVKGKWSALHGEMLIDMKDNIIFGVTESRFQSITNALVTAKLGGFGMGSEDSKRIISIDGLIINSSIEYQLKIQITAGSTLLTGLGETEYVFKGLMCVSKDAQNISVMERKVGKEEIEFYEMKRIL